MPILYNFHIFLANFYMIYWTNLLIQCPVPVPVCCMFFVSQKPNIKWNPNGIKTDGELFWNIWDFPEDESTWNGVRGGHETGAPPGRALDPRGPLGYRLALIPLPKIHIYSKKISVSFFPFGLRLIWIFCKTKNMQQTGTGTVHWINMC